MKKYFKHFIYYLINLFDSIFNLVCALFGYYPQLEIGMSFLVRLETKRITEELDSNDEKKQGQLADADEKVKLAKDLI